MRRTNIVIPMLSLIYCLSCFLVNPNVCSQPLNREQESIKYTQFATIDILVILYTNTSGSQITDEEVKRIKNGIELARGFYWRNSGCKLNLNISYLEIPESKPKSFFPEDGLLWPKFVEQDFKNHGVKEDQYGIIVLIYSPPLGGGNYGGMQILGSSGYSFFRFPFRTSVLYPEEDDSIEYKCTWLFTHELQHSVDLVCYEKSNCPAMWHGDQPLDYSIQAGEQFSYQAEIYRNFNDYLNMKKPWGYVIQANDMDGDNLPDKDSRVPMDEHRLESDSLKVDTDLDGLTDIEEYMAGIYKASDPNDMDTDNDGLIDGKDPYPLNITSPEIPKLTPDFDSSVQNWYLVTNTIDFSTSNFLGDEALSAKIYMSWDDDYLYFASVTNAPAELHLDLDMDNDGWWHGRDNLRIVTDPFSDQFTEIRIMDTTERARKLRLKLSRGYYEMWDDEPEYISQFGRLVDEFSVKLLTSSIENQFIIKIAIPTNKLIDFIPASDKTLGVRIYYYQIATPKEAQWATVFEQYSFFDVILK